MVIRVGEVDSLQAFWCDENAAADQIDFAGGHGSDEAAEFHVRILDLATNGGGESGDKLSVDTDNLAILYVQVGRVRRIDTRLEDSVAPIVHDGGHYPRVLVLPMLEQFVVLARTAQFCQKGIELVTQGGV